MKTLESRYRNRLKFDSERFITDLPRRENLKIANEHIRVLLFDDDQVASRFINAALSSRGKTRPKFEIDTVKTLDQAFEKIRNKSPDVIFASLASKQNEILSTIKEIRSLDTDIPIITLGETGFANLALECIKAGAQDCIFPETTNSSQIIPAIQFAIERRKISSDLLQLHERQLKATIEAAQDGIIVVSSDKKVMFVNPSAERLLGKSAKNLIGQTVPLPFRPSKKVAHELKDDDGTTIYIEISTAIVPWEDDEAGYCLTLRDVTEYRRLQNELESASKLKSEFIAHMSHELRTPMNGIIGATSLLADSHFGKDRDELLSIIRNSSEHMLDIINDLLDLSKIEAGRIELEKTDFRIRSLVEETFDLFADRVKSKGILLTNIVASEVPRFVIGDPSRVRQVLANLVSNAVKFTDRGIVKVYVDLDDKNSLNPKLVFKVKDSGIGIARKNHEKLFHPFTQLSTDPEKRKAGTGLGLVITRKLATAMRGEVGFISEFGKGSEFWFSIPLIDASEMTNDKPNIKSLAGKKVLSMTNDSDLQASLQEMLGCKGIECKTNFSSDALINCINEKKCDIILIDDQFNDSNWSSIVKCIREELQSKIPIILLSSRFGIDLKETTHYEISVIDKSPLKQSEVYGFIADLLTDEHNGTLTFDEEEQERQIRIALNYRDSQIGSGRALIAEDNLINQKVITSMLDRFGIETDAVANGLEAVEAAKNRRYNVILMDCRMPVMNGFEAAEQIRKSSSLNAKTPIIAVTANASKEDKRRCQESGMDGFIAKPIKVEDLRDVLLSKLSENNPEFFSGRPVDENGDCIIDEKTIESLERVGKKCGSNLVEEVASIFINTSPDLIAELGLAIQNKNRASINSLAHKLKGSARNIGAKIMAQKCGKLEEGESNSDRAGVIFNEIESAYHEAVLSLKDRIKGLELAAGI